MHKVNTIRENWQVPYMVFQGHKNDLKINLSEVHWLLSIVYRLLFLVNDSLFHVCTSNHIYYQDILHLFTIGHRQINIDIWDAVRSSLYSVEEHFTVLILNRLTILCTKNIYHNINFLHYDLWSLPYIFIHFLYISGRITFKLNQSTW